jgi:hypothetical protein
MTTCKSSLQTSREGTVHEPIVEFPKGKVLGSCRLARGQQIVDVTRIKYGSVTRFVESVTNQGGRYGPVRTALRRTDDFPSDKIADRFITAWLTAIVSNRGYRVVHIDPAFDPQKDSDLNTGRTDDGRCGVAE